MSNRRDFIKKVGVGTIGLTFGGALPGFSASSYQRIIGANDRINVSMIGVNARGDAVARNFARQTSHCEIAAICDVDTNAIAKCVDNVSGIQSRAPKGEKDFRRTLEDAQIDAVVIATPDHWHTPAALLALQASKHVYLEKPVSYCPREGEMLVEATAKYGKVVQIGTQRRTWPKVVEAVREVQNGVIGKVHFGKGWYANNRASIGTGNIAPVPDWLDWDLWQGPAPRTAYRDNIVHYNWHWFWHWGTAETLNNGTHMIDLLLWGMHLNYPTKVSSIGGRYYYRDDWETPDTQTVTLEFGNNVSMLWEGYSCSGRNIDNSSVGSVFYGDTGSVYISAGNDYKIYDKRNRVVKEVTSDIVVDQQNRISPSDQLDIFHIIEFFDGIKKGTPLSTTAESGHKCTLLMQLANISLRTGRTLNINPDNGRILQDEDAQKLWSRQYEPGWEPKI
jgi:predicted dehydrogenase